MRQPTDRLYGFSYPDKTPVLFGDIGNKLKIAGVILRGQGGIEIGALIPGEESLYHEDAEEGCKDFEPVFPVELDGEEWRVLLTSLDDPLYFANYNETRIIHRKVFRQISGVVQQRVWAADGFICQVCGRKMGDIQLTIDHFTPLELNGSDEPDNLLSMCSKCNRNKGSRDPQEFCKTEHTPLTYDQYIAYMKQRVIKIK